MKTFCYIMYFDELTVWNFWQFCRISVIFMVSLIPLFCISGDVRPGFKARWIPLIVCSVTCTQYAPQIHTWCDTCQTLGGQHCSQNSSNHLLFQALVVVVMPQHVTDRRSNRLSYCGSNGGMGLW